MSRKLFALALVLVACSAFARIRAVATPDSARITDSGTVSGVVSGVSGNLVQIANGAVTIDASQAKIVVGRGKEATIADIKPGMQLFAAIRESNPSHGGIPATLITVTDQPDVTISGPVDTVDAANRSFTVLNQTVRTDANTSFGGYKRDAVTTFADIQPNVIVYVAADNIGGRLVAREVLIVAPAVPQIGHAHGTVQSIGTDSWTIKTERETITVVINAQTKIAGSPKVGDEVEVLYNINSAHQYVAVSIVKFERITPPSLEHFHGNVKSISGNAWTVTVNGADRSFTTNESTKMTPNIAVGDPVDVIAVKRDDGSLVAVTIVRLRL
ncbi:MAG TPA: DUF5666 domain-containing protein [Thermoanaerobaculia bacterium]|jgi:hypothetical protein|nr:DUF5666 domain-containing protein [Thermoanaerobaculia bacterium]